MIVFAFQMQVLRPFTSVELPCYVVSTQTALSYGQHLAKLGQHAGPRWKTNLLQGCLLGIRPVALIILDHQLPTRAELM